MSKAPNIPRPFSTAQVIQKILSKSEDLHNFSWHAWFLWLRVDSPLHNPYAG
jgi:hypothetical protein